MEDKMLRTKDTNNTNDMVASCSPVVGHVMSNCHSYEDEEMIKRILELRKKTQMTFGEIILLLLHDIRPQVTPGYFMVLYYAARRLEPFYDYFVQDITLEDLDKASLGALCCFTSAKVPDTVRIGNYSEYLGTV